MEHGEMKRVRSLEPRHYSVVIMEWRRLTAQWVIWHECIDSVTLLPSFNARRWVGFDLLPDVIQPCIKPTWRVFRVKTDSRLNIWYLSSLGNSSSSSTMYMYHVRRYPNKLFGWLSLDDGCWFSCKVGRLSQIQKLLACVSELLDLGSDGVFCWLEVGAFLHSSLQLPCSWKFLLPDWEFFTTMERRR